MQESISVVMPYYKNERTLLACLNSFASQQGAQALELVVVDDGGPCRAADVCAQFDKKLPLTLLRTNRAGQSAATNAGIEVAQGSIVMLTCADIIASKQLLFEHLQAHQQAPNRAVLGYIPYASTVKMTPFMQFLRSSEVQFDFASIDDVDHVNNVLLYAPNVSVRREHLAAVGGFDAAFTYGYQDTDLGLRLAKIGVQLVYRAKAIGYHDHPNDFLNFVRRQEIIGEAALLMLERHPSSKLERIFSMGAHFALPRLKLFDALLVDAVRFEASVIQRPLLFRRVRRELFELYRLVLFLAVYRGTLRKRDAYPQSLKSKISALLAQTPSWSDVAPAPPNGQTGMLNAGA